MILDDGQDQGTRIVVIGVGGAGGNAVNTMIDAGVDGVQFIAANTDKQALANNQAETRIQIGETRTNGLGAGSMPSVGQEAAQESASMIQEHLKGANMVFVTAGMGGGTGTGAAPIIAGIARQLGALTIGVVTKPFKFEGRRRRKQAEEGIINLQKNVDTLITIPNERLLNTIGESMTLVDAFREADSVLLNAVRSISELITHPGLVNTDFNDVRTVMSNKGLALMGTGIGTGPDRAIDAAEAAISSPLLDDVSLEGATSVLLNITAPRTATLFEINAAASLIEEATAEDAHLIWGHVINEDENCDSIKITIIATGFEHANAAMEDQSAAGAAKPLGVMDSAGSMGYSSGNFMHTNRKAAFDMGKDSYAASAAAATVAVDAKPSSDVRANSTGFVPDDIAARMRAIEAQGDIYDGQQQSASYAPVRKSANYPVVDVYAPVDKVAPAAKSQTVAAAADNSVPSQIDEPYSEDEIENIPAFLRQKNKKYFLD